MNVIKKLFFITITIILLISCNLQDKETGLENDIDKKNEEKGKPAEKADIYDKESLANFLALEYEIDNEDIMADMIYIYRDFDRDKSIDVLCHSSSPEGKGFKDVAIITVVDNRFTLIPHEIGILDLIDNCMISIIGDFLRVDIVDHGTGEQQSICRLYYYNGQKFVDTNVRLQTYGYSFVNNEQAKVYDGTITDISNNGSFKDFEYVLLKKREGSDDIVGIVDEVYLFNEDTCTFEAVDTEQKSLRYREEIRINEEMPIYSFDFHYMYAENGLHTNDYYQDLKIKITDMEDNLIQEITEEVFFRCKFSCLVDANFDGYKDIVYLYEDGGAHAIPRYYIYLWDDSKKQYVKNDNEFSYLLIDNDSKKLYTSGPGSASCMYYDIYKSVNGDLVKTNTLRKDIVSDYDLDTFAITKERYEELKKDAKNNYLIWGYDEWGLVDGKLKQVSSLLDNETDEKIMKEIFDRYYALDSIWELDSYKWYVNRKYDSTNYTIDSILKDKARDLAIKCTEYIKTNFKNVDTVLFVKETNLDGDEVTEVVVACGKEMSDYKNLDRLFVLRKINGKLEVIINEELQHPYGYIGISIAKTTFSTGNSIVLDISNGRMHGIEVRSLVNDELVTVLHSASPTGIGNDYLTSFNTDGIYDGYVTNRNSYGVLWYDVRCKYRYIDNKFVLENKVINEYGEYPKNIEDVILEYISIIYLSGLNSDYFTEKFYGICNENYSDETHISLKGDLYNLVYEYVLFGDNAVFEIAEDNNKATVYLTYSLKQESPDDKVTYTFDMELINEKWRIVKIRKGKN